MQSEMERLQARVRELEAQVADLHQIIDTQMRIIRNALSILTENGELAAEMREAMKGRPKTSEPIPFPADWRVERGRS